MSEDLFTNRAPSPPQAVLLDILTQEFLHLAEVIEDNLPASRFRSLALTKLEETSMWAKKATVFTFEV